MQLGVRTEPTVKGTITIKGKKKQKTFAEWSSSVSLPKWLPVLLLIFAAARSEQVIVAVSPAEFGLRNNVFRHSAKSTKCM